MDLFQGVEWSVCVCVCVCVCVYVHVVDQLVRSEANISTAGGRLVGMVMRGDF